jgi:hypothetical protein
MNKKVWLFFCGSVLICGGMRSKAASYYPLRLEDAKAIYLTADNFPVHGDGVADDSAAVQAAVDRASEHGEGIVFVPSGRYRVTRTIFVWPGVRVIGYGETRPVFVLADNTPGYQQGLGYMFLFTGGKSRQGPSIDIATGRPPAPIVGIVPPNASIPDANPGTFYSAMSNVDFEIGKGNPAAVGVRFHVAQHCYLAHMDFWIGSGLAALKDIGNEGEDLHFHGGQYGIVTERPSPGWQFTLIDSSFEGQSRAAIQEHEAGLVLVHDTFSDVPQAVSIDPGYSEELWVVRSRFLDISGAAIKFGNENNARTEINLQGIACRHVKVFAQIRETGKAIYGPGENYVVKTFSHGLTLKNPADWGSIETKFDAETVAELPAAGNNAIAALPPMKTWVNLKSLGVKGDGMTDDTAAIRKAIEEHAAIYVPTGRYLVTGTIQLRPDSVLVGLHPSLTQIDLKDESPGFQGVGGPRALLEAPRGGHNIVTGIGLFTGGINDRAVGALWKAGADSLMDDVRFLGGHGTNTAEGTRLNPYNSTHTGDPNPLYRWDAQYPSLWVTDGGGGTFADIWTPSTFAAAGLLISDTSTPGYVYELSCEHHVRNEIRLDKAENWELDALQTEEEWGESPNALPIEINRSRNITLANYHGYRVIRSYAPFRYAVKISESTGIEIRNMHVDSNSKVSFDNSVFDATHHAEVRAREFAVLDVPGTGPVSDPAAPPLAVVKKLADGFFSISGAAVDAEGTLYFVDTHWQRIYRWDAEHGEAVTVSSDPLQPENLAFDKAGDLMVVSRSGAGTIYAFRPDGKAGEIKMIQQQPAMDRGGSVEYLPVDVYASRQFSPERNWQYVAPDGSTYISAGDDFVQGHTEWGTKMADLLRAFGLESAIAGKPFFVTMENDEKTFRGTLTAAGSVTDLKLFAETGGESVVQDAHGRVYVAAGQILVYSPDGGLFERIEVPERPIDLVFGGSDRRTLYILTHHSVYAVKTETAGM